MSGSKLARADRELLIVEDDESSLNGLSGILRIWGWNVQTAATIADALGLLDRNPSAVILDLMLPDGDGASVLEYIRQSSLDTRVIVTTGASDAILLDFVRRLSPVTILTKPINLPQLQNFLDQLR